ncbi:MAG: threonylcarbamoyl-AMP synthase [Desulfobulbaceae bacterium]|nr:threonylcarbamoyl-AMP synthase [Desulfobulbaceae bacterium]
MSKFEDISPNRFGTSLSLAADYLRQGKIVAFPTETYYGLGVDPGNDGALARLFSLKQRQADKPLLLLIKNRNQLDSLVSHVPSQYPELMDRYWPGPLTLIFPAHQSLNSKLTANTNTVGIRISPHPVASSLVQHVGMPITATSCNISGYSPAKSAEEVLRIFGEGVDYILDGGVTEAGFSSTIMTISEGRLSLIRAGKICVAEKYFQR